MTYLPDTNIFIQAFRNQEPEASFLKRQIEKNAIVLSVVVIAEFLVKATEEQKETFGAIKKAFRKLPIDEEIASIAATYRTEYSRKTKRIFLLDCFLAAQAKVHRLTLVTNNKADFPMKDIRVVSP
ncbi:MAG: PIN domain-containing protein [Candidatus Levybacteria bacterium]|nr:PIN domain-containing protein [Candidatus Levybacteria bacterium]